VGTLMVVIVVIVVVVIVVTAAVGVAVVGVAVVGVATIRTATVRLAGWFRNRRDSRRSGDGLALVQRGIPFPTLATLGRRAVRGRLVPRDTARLVIVPIVTGRGALGILRGTRG
jgi:hypothetical protein